MALTFTSWTNYTDDDGNPRALDWTDPAGCLTRAHAEAVRQAIVERCGAAGTAVPAALTTAVEPNTLFLATLANAVQTLMTSWLYETPFPISSGAFGPWANQSINGGNFTDQPCMERYGDFVYAAIPRWNSTTITAVVGARIVVNIISGAWIKQQYEMLRRCLWTVSECKGAAGELAYVIGTWQRREGIDWPTSVWEPGYTFITGLIGSAFFPSTGQYRRQAFNFLWTPPTGLNCNGDFYGILDDNSFGQFHMFWGADVGADAQYDGALLMADIASTGAPVTVTLGELDIAPAIKPGETVGHGWTCPYRSVWTLGASIAAVNRWDVPGGFVFQGS